MSGSNICDHGRKQLASAGLCQEADACAAQLVDEGPDACVIWRQSEFGCHLGTEAGGMGDDGREWARLIRIQCLALSLLPQDVGKPLNPSELP